MILNIQILFNGKYYIMVNHYLPIKIRLLKTHYLMINISVEFPKNKMF